MRNAASHAEALGGAPDDTGTNPPQHNTAGGPLMDFAHSARAQGYIKRLRDFLDREVIPFEDDYMRENRALNDGADWTKWQSLPRMEDWKVKLYCFGTFRKKILESKI